MSDKTMTYVPEYHCCWLVDTGESGCFDNNGGSVGDDHDTLKDALDEISDYIVKNPPRFFVDRYNPDNSRRYLEYESVTVNRFVWDEDENEWEFVGEAELPDWAMDTRGGRIAEYAELLDMGMDGYGHAREIDLPLDLKSQPYDNDTQRGHYVPYSWLNR